MTTPEKRREMMVSAGMDDDEIKVAEWMVANSRKVNGRWLVHVDGDLCDVTNLVEVAS